MFEEYPSAILQHSMLPLLPVKSLVNLDTAYCAKSGRDELHRCMSGLHVSFEELDEFTTNEVYQILRWMSERRVYFKTCSTDCNMDLDKIVRHGLLSCFKKVEELSICTKGNSTVCNRVAGSIDCNHLNKLWLHGTSVGATDSFVEELTRRQPRIHELHLAKSNILTDASLHHIANNCTGLRLLSVLECKGINFSDSAMRDLGARCLDLKTIRLLISTPLLLNTVLIRMSQYCINIEDLTTTRPVSEASLIAIAQGCRKLKKIDVVGMLSAAGFSQMARHCKSLVCLRIELHENDTRIAEGFSYLSSTLTEYSGNMCASTIFESAPHWHVLTSLKLDNCTCTWTDELLERVAVCCKELAVLNIGRDASTITDAGVLSLATHLVQLTDIKISGCKQVSDVGVTALASRCTKLVRVVLSGSLHLTDAGARSLLSRKNIKKLKLYNCPSVSAEIMDSLRVQFQD